MTCEQCVYYFTLYCSNSLSAVAREDPRAAFRRRCGEELRNSVLSYRTQQERAFLLAYRLLTWNLIGGQSAALAVPPWIVLLFCSFTLKYIFYRFNSDTPNTFSYQKHSY